MAGYYRRNREYYKAHSNKHYHNLPPEKKAKRADKQYMWKVLRVYGIDQSKYEALLEKQHGVCPVCKGAFYGKRRPVVDHDHSTGAVRGLLHGQCNTLLGMAKDSITVLEGAADYLRKQRED